ncbi:MAG: 4Fe-4S dicluster domain-containing protein [Candidatus Limnocylindrales bacterium]|jgi:nitrate reductase gamma subunit/NAD-dependent dihydropyrimidine dehydrogenase PreA subunit
MTARVDHNLYPELKRFGATDISACYNCGVCSAICPLSADGASFPRRMSRYAQLGLREQLLSSPELWSCYGCSECTESCPTQADPASFMAAARRYAVASYDRTHIAYLLATSRLFAGVFVVALVGLLAAFMYSVHQPADASTLAFFQFIPSDFVHNLGIVVMAVMGVTALAGLFEMIRRVLRGPRPGATGATFRKAADAAVYAVGTESLAQARFRKDCADATETRPWYSQRWFIHFATMWGFLGLLGATISDYGLELLGVKAVGAPVPIWYPVRLLGTLAGAALIYGTTVMIVRRLRKSDRSSLHSTTSDWIFLSMLWVAGVSGFALELGLYLPQTPAWGYPMFLVHVGVAMALVLLVPFGKFAHVFYRPVALFAIRLRG